MKPSQESRVRKYLTSEGIEGEEVLAVALAYPAGRVARVVSGMKGEVLGAAGGGGAGALAGKKIARDRSKRATDAATDRSAGADFPVNERNVLALTTGRVLIFSLGGFITPQPRKLLWDIELDDVDGVSKPVLTTGMAKALRVDISVADGRVRTGGQRGARLRSHLLIKIDDAPDSG